MKIFCIICEDKILKKSSDKNLNAIVTLMVGHRDRLVVYKGHLKMTISRQQPPVSNYPAVQALGITEYDLKRPVDGVNLERKDPFVNSNAMRACTRPTSLLSIW